MPKKLTDEQVEAYRRDGFVGGIQVLSDKEVSRFRSELEAFEASNGKALDFPERSKSYLLFEFADAIVHHPAVLDAVEDFLINKRSQLKPKPINLLRKLKVRRRLRKELARMAPESSG